MLPPRMKVLFFVPQLDGGGAEMNAVRLSEGLLHSEVVPYYAVSKKGGTYEKHLPPGAEVYGLIQGSSGSSTLRLLRCIAPLARLIDEVRPDILCPVMPLPAYVAYASRVLSRHKPPIVASVQLALERPQAVKVDLRDWLETRLVPFIFPRFQKIVALSEGVRRDYNNASSALHDRICVIPNVGTPTTGQLALRSAVVPDKVRSIRFVACGRLSPQKGYPILLNAFAQVKEDVDAELLIVGEGPLRPQLVEQACLLGLQDRVRFVGFHEDPYSFIESGDVFVLSSHWEGFANVIVEAMALGVPVVATDCPHGPAEIITSGKDGMLVPPGDEATLARTMTLLAGDPDLRRRLAADGRLRAEFYSSERIGAQYATVFRRVAASAGEA